MTRPRILVTCWRRPLPTYLGERTILDTLDPAYAAQVFDAGGLPLVVSRPPGDALDDLLSMADGLVLTGGGDVDPASYGAELENADDPDAGADDVGARADRRRARTRVADARDLPWRTVARGRARRAAGPAAVGRRRPSPSSTASRPRQILSARHEVELVPGSRVQRALGGDRDRIAVNTIHHHEIADAGELEVTGTAPGGVIEAVEPRSDWAVRRGSVASREDARARAGRAVRAARGRLS